jgi:hypothetical protein
MSSLMTRSRSSRRSVGTTAYLSRVAPDETIEQRHYVAKHLAGLV